MPFGSFEVDLKSLRRHWREGVVHFTLRLDGDTEPPLDVQTIREIADGVSEWLVESGTANPITAEGWIGLRSGWAGVLNHADEWNQVIEWLERLTATLSALSGKIRGGPADRGPKYVPRHLRWEPAAMCAYTTVDLTTIQLPERDRIWGVEERLTRALAQKASDWTTFAGATNFFDDGIIVPTVDTDLGVPLAEARLRRNVVMSQVTNERLIPYASRDAILGPHGQVGYMVWDENLDWRSKYNELLQALTWAPQRLDLAFIRYAHQPLWMGLFSPDWPHIREADYRYNRPLLAQFVPDANGIQVLTDAHLDHAHDLSEWRIEPLPGGRHLVSTPQIEAWYAQPEPPNELLHEARVDFGEMILTPETIDEHSPWSD